MFWKNKTFHDLEVWQTTYNVDQKYDISRNFETLMLYEITIGCHVRLLNI